ncbi:homocysteine S-methyltransferase family protein [Desulfopila aestuarii]|uniref:Homocysteine S-methyltransferase n=1 Tax=Desulfopila aestuarii DSM 18488 TaxID=1121416 RepID=A0A1M7Y7G7_9BACT|nr:homocysteine S-methyltransferase family protein [Desulfopila aestuarii]SHO48582.1 homocysteine S-methyltransferase [Desulfopila aestuarii DSM 18488]
MDFVTTLQASPLMLTEAAISERLRRRDDVTLHPMLFNTPLIYDEHGRQCLAEIYGQYREIAREAGLPLLLCAPTWRVDRERTAAAGFDASLNRDAVSFMLELRDRWQDRQSPVFVGGLIGPKNDCYMPALALSADEAEMYHGWQIRELAAAGVDVVVGQTFPAVSEALGVARASAKAGVAHLISFVINRHGKVLDGTVLAEAIARIDRETAGGPAGYMVNCVHPSFLLPSQQPSNLFTRLVGIQANSSSLDHDQLDGAVELKQDDMRDWGEQMLALNREYGMKILGGCCGTDDAYLRYIALGGENASL